MTLRYHARDLAAMSKDALWQLPDGAITVDFDPLPDGTPQVLESNVRLTRFSAYFWEILVEYPKTPARIEHHIGNQRLRNNTHMTLLNSVMWDCYDAYRGEVDREAIWERLYIAYNQYYNDYTTRPGMEEEISTISIEDLVAVTEHPLIKQAIEQINETNGRQTAIDEAHRVAIEVMNDPAALPGNPLSCSIRSKLISNSQFLQCLIAHGPASALDSHYFYAPIPSSFLSGMNSLAESLMESQTSTKAAAYKEKPIQDSEYFNRKLQLLAATVQSVSYTLNVLGADESATSLVAGDCGTQRTVRWFVKKSDLNALAGKYYVQADGSLKAMKKTDTHLVGETIHMRAVSLCRHSESQSVCAACYGELALALPVGTNIGHMASVEYGERVTQSMLGIKHVNFTAGAKGIEIGSYEREFMAVGPAPREMHFNATVAKSRRVTVSFAADEVAYLSEVMHDNADRLPISRISEVSEFFLTLELPNGEKETTPLTAEVQGKKAHLTQAFLRHVKESGYVLADSGRYVIDVTGFDFRQPIFEVPNRDDNIMDYLNSIVRFITSSKPDKSAPTKSSEENVKMLAQCKTLEEAILSFHELTSAKMEVNVVHLEVLIYSTMVRSIRKRDYRLPGPGNALVFGQLAKIIASRSLSAAMAFEGHSDILNDPATYVNQYRPDHPLDDLLVPRNAVA